MSAPDLKADAALGALAGIAFDMFTQGVLAPAPDPRLSPEWLIRGYITALDAILPRFGPLQLGEKAYYGFLAESVGTPGRFVATIRGTADLTEWGIDAMFTLTPHHTGGRVELGFSGLYQTMRYRPVTPGAPDSPMAPGLAAAVGQGSLTVIGHSLGSALATLATLDMVLIHGMEDRVRGRFFCSPKVGDAAFVDTFAFYVKDAAGYILPGDIVPMVPKGLGYTQLRCTITVGPDIAQSVIKDSRLCFHHIYSILSAMDFDLMNWASVPAVDRDLTACILGPKSPGPLGAAPSV